MFGYDVDIKNSCKKPEASEQMHHHDIFGRAFVYSIYWTTIVTLEDSSLPSDQGAPNCTTKDNGYELLCHYVDGGPLLRPGVLEPICIQTSTATPGAGGICLDTPVSCATVRSVPEKAEAVLLTDHHRRSKRKSLLSRV